MSVAMSISTQPSAVDHQAWSVQRLRGPEALLAEAPAWQALWEASDTSLVQMQAETIASWCDRVAMGDRLDTWWVRANGTPVAALPLVRRRLKHLVGAHTLPTDPYVFYADPLLDASHPEADAALERLLADILADGPSILWLEQAGYRRAVWRRLIAAAEGLGLHVSIHHHHHVGRVALADSWDQYRGQLSKHRRSNLRNKRNRLQRKHGPLRLQRVRPRTDGEADRWLRLALEVESRSWKAEAGTAITQDAVGMAYFLGLGRLMARQGRCVLYFLKAGERIVASSYGLQARGVLHQLKFSYDRAYGDFGPGQLLLWYLLADLHARDDVTTFDFFGEYDEYMRCWITDTEPMGRVVIAADRPVARAVHNCHEHVLPTLRRCLGRDG